MANNILPQRRLSRTRDPFLGRDLDELYRIARRGSVAEATPVGGVVSYLPSAVSTAGDRATYGVLAIPRTLVEISSLHGFINPNGSGREFFAQVSQLSGTGSGASIVAVLGTSETLAPVGSSFVRLLRFSFPAPILLEEGIPYLFSISRSDEDPDSPLTMLYINPSSDNVFEHNLPIDTGSSLRAYESIGVVPSQVADATPAGKLMVYANAT